MLGSDNFFRERFEGFVRRDGYFRLINKGTAVHCHAYQIPANTTQKRSLT